MSTISPSLKIGLRFLGVWPGVSHFTFFIYSLSIFIVQYFQYLYVSAHLKLSELPNLVDSLPATLDYTLTLLKLASLWTHRRVINQILIAMDNDWRECIGVEQHLYVMTFKANISHFFSNAILSFNTIVAALYLLGEYAIRAAHIVGDHNNTLRQLPIKVQLPFDTEQSPIFELFVVILFLHVMANACTLSIVNGLIFSLVLHISGQIDIICHELKIISDEVSLYGSSKSTLETLIKRHNRVILFSNNIDKLFSFMALMQVFGNTLVICCLGFIVVISVGNENSVFMLVKSAIVYVAVMVEAFIFCFAGEYLSHKSKLIADAAYESLWYDMPLSQGKNVTFIIMRSQKRLTITAGKIMNLSFESFTSMMKASASYISVLNAMY
ncbi:odorant receptor 10-like isoform X2 [Linepithema humile]|uniref:odorant receptor 10-like isoform X2 n=1 Tax=Linepithema humile TaxID=83485 RepID=UPI00351DC481